MLRNIVIISYSKAFSDERTNPYLRCGSDGRCLRTGKKWGDPGPTGQPGWKKKQTKYTVPHCMGLYCTVLSLAKAAYAMIGECVQNRLEEQIYMPIRVTAAAKQKTGQARRLLPCREAVKNFQMGEELLKSRNFPFKNTYPPFGYL